MQIVKTFTSADGKHRLEIVRDDRGLYSYEITSETVEDIPDSGPEIYWSPSFVSGLYATEEEVERDAIAETPWLRPAEG